MWWVWRLVSLVKAVSSFSYITHLPNTDFFFSSNVTYIFRKTIGWNYILSIRKLSLFNFILTLGEVMQLCLYSSCVVHKTRPFLDISTKCTFWLIKVTELFYFTLILFHAISRATHTFKVNQRKSQSKKPKMSLDCLALL